MAPSRAAFRARLRGLPPATAIDFLADLYAAQGWSVDRQDGRLIVSRGGTTETVVLADAATDLASADVVVVRDAASADIGPAGAERLDPDDLYGRARYAVDEAATEHLLSTYFGDLPVSSSSDRYDQSPDGPSSDREVPMDNERSDDAPPLGTWSRRALLVAAGGVLGGGAALTATGLDQAPRISAPGVTADGVTDPDALATAHGAATTARSYTLELDDVRRDATLGLRSAIALDLSLSADRSYLAVVSTAGPEAPLVLGRPPATSVYWSDGERYFVDHQPDAWAGVSSFRPLRGWVGTWRYWSHVFAFGGRIDSAPEDYFRALFEAVPVRLVDHGGTGDEARYRLAGRADAPGTTLETLAGTDHYDLELTAVVDGAGMVRTHDVRYRGWFDGDQGRVHRSLTYTKVGETTVDRPVWTMSSAPDLSTRRTTLEE